MSPNKAALSATFHLTAGGRGRQEQAGQAGMHQKSRARSSIACISTKTFGNIQLKAQYFIVSI
jgi:hypothetical protein